MIAFDLETHRIRRPVAAPKPVCVQWCARAPKHDQEGELAKIGDAINLIGVWLRQGALLYGHSIKYDMMVLMAYEPDLIEPIFAAYSNDRIQDTLLNQKLIDIAHGELEFRKTRGYDLGTVAKRYDIAVDKSDPWRLRYGELENIPLEHWPEDAKRYAILDATATYRIAEGQKAVCKEWEAQYGSPILHHGPARARYDLALGLASAWGCRTNEKRCAIVEAFTHAEIARMKEILFDAGLVRKNGSKDTKAAKARVEAAFAAKGEAVPQTDNEDVSTEKDTMILSGDEVLVVYAEYTTAKNLLNRVEDLKKGIHLPLQPRYDSLLETGRTSSSKGTKKGKVEPDQIEGIQIQNFPRAYDKKQIAMLKELGMRTDVGARECLEPRPGNVFVLADYAGAELHALAQVHYQLFGRSTLGDMLNDGVDVLMKVGVAAYGNGVSYEEAVKNKKKEPYDGWRQAAKPIVYGRPGGMGAKKIVITARKSYGVILDVPEAQRLIRLYEEIVPELRPYFDHVDGMLGGKQRGIMRQLFSGRWRGGATYCGVANSYFQGLTADGALEAMWAVVLECYADRNSVLYSYRPVAFVHDELLMEGPEDRAHDAAIRLSRIMEKQMRQYTPQYPTPAEPVVTRTWSKNAKAVRGADGRLVPWDLA